jgi:hypothetical protein
MALRVARGLFRLWLILSVLWIGGVGVVTWRTFPVIPDWAIECERPKVDFDPDAFLADKPQPQAPCPWLEWVKAQLIMDKEQRAALQSAILLALVPPALVLAFGSALTWALRGFR